jgi:hypothetical protein
MVTNNESHMRNSKQAIHEEKTGVFSESFKRWWHWSSVRGTPKELVEVKKMNQDGHWYGGWKDPGGSWG